MRSRGGSITFALQCGCLAALLGSFVPAAHASKDNPLYWFGNAYRSDVRFTVMSRRFTDRTVSEPRRFVFIADGFSKQIEHEQTPQLASPDLRKVVSGVLQRRGYLPAKTLDDAELAIAITYGRGFYPPPLQFAGISERVPPWDWPAALREYREMYAPHWLQNEEPEAQGGLTAAWMAENTVAAPRGIADQVNLITVKAYDWPRLKAKGQLTLIWETRVTTSARSRPLETYAAAMIASASTYFDTEHGGGLTLRSNELRGEVKLGPLKSFGEVALPVPAVQVPDEESPLRGAEVRSFPR